MALKGKVKTTQKDGLVVVQESITGEVLYDKDFSDIVFRIKEGYLDAIGLANYVAELMHDCINMELVSSSLSDLNERGVYRDFPSELQAFSFRVKELKVNMANIIFDILDKTSNGKWKSADYRLNGSDDVDFIADYYNNNDCFEIDFFKGNRVLVFDDQYLFEYEPVVYDLDNKEYVDYNEYSAYCDLMNNSEEQKQDEPDLDDFDY